MTKVEESISHQGNDVIIVNINSKIFYIKHFNKQKKEKATKDLIDESEFNQAHLKALDEEVKSEYQLLKNELKNLPLKNITDQSKINQAHLENLNEKFNSESQFLKNELKNLPSKLFHDIWQVGDIDCWNDCGKSGKCAKCGQNGATGYCCRPNWKENGDCPDHTILMKSPIKLNYHHCFSKLTIFTDNSNE